MACARPTCSALTKTVTSVQMLPLVLHVPKTTLLLLSAAALPCVILLIVHLVLRSLLVVNA